MLILLVPPAFRGPMLFSPDVDPLLGFSLNDQQAMRKISRMLHTHTVSTPGHILRPCVSPACPPPSSSQACYWSPVRTAKGCRTTLTLYRRNSSISPYSCPLPPTCHLYIAIFILKTVSLVIFSASFDLWTQK